MHRLVRIVYYYYYIFCQEFIRGTSACHCILYHVLRLGMDQSYVAHQCVMSLREKRDHFVTHLLMSPGDLTSYRKVRNWNSTSDSTHGT